MGGEDLPPSWYNWSPCSARRIFRTRAGSAGRRDSFRDTQQHSWHWLEQMEKMQPCSVVAWQEDERQQHKLKHAEVRLEIKETLYRWVQPRSGTDAQGGWTVSITGNISYLGWENPWAAQSEPTAEPAPDRAWFWRPPLLPESIVLWFLCTVILIIFQGMEAQENRVIHPMVQVYTESQMLIKEFSSSLPLIIKILILLNPEMQVSRI